MLPYSEGLILDNTNNYGLVKTETDFGFGPPNHNYSYMKNNAREPLEWIFAQNRFAPRSLQGTSRIQPKQTTVKPHQRSKNNKNKKHFKKLKRKKCIFNVKRGLKKSRRRNKLRKMQKKYIMPILLGILAAKSLLIPIALKLVAFISAKGLMMGLFSTVLASVLSLKGMFDHSRSTKKDDTKTQVEIIQVPSTSKSEDHIYYDDHYRKGDYDIVPVNHKLLNY